VLSARVRRFGFRRYIGIHPISNTDPAKKAMSQEWADIVFFLAAFDIGGGEPNRIEVRRE
jgi:hypothetical protein